MYKNPRLENVVIRLDDIHLSVKFVMRERLQLARRLVTQKIGKRLEFSQCVVTRHGRVNQCVFPIIIEMNPYGWFCVDGSHRLVALHEIGTDAVEVVGVSDTMLRRPPAKLFPIRDVEVVDTCQHWQDRFVDFQEEHFRGIAGRLNSMPSHVIDTD